MTEYLAHSPSQNLTKFDEADDWPEFSRLVLETAEKTPTDVDMCEQIAKLAEDKFVNGRDGVITIYRFAAVKPTGLEELVRAAEAAATTAICEPVSPAASTRPSGSSAHRHDATLAGALILETRDPTCSAREFVRADYQFDGVATLLFSQGQFYRWNGRYWRAFAPGDLRAEVYRFLGRALVPTRDKDRFDRFMPDRDKVSKVMDALEAVVNLSSEISAPAWLEGEAPAPVREMFVCENGLVHGPSQQIWQHNPRFWSHSALDFKFDPQAKCERWDRFLEELWPGDSEMQATLAEVFGLCLTDDTRYQKAFLFWGPPRSGKGTIGNVLKGVIGEENYIGPTAASFANEFALQGWIGKKLAVLSDARFGAGGADGRVIERLLSITGEDTLQINRKNKDYWNGVLRTRVIILTNEMPQFRDESGAMAKRFIVLPTKQSFYGREDTGLLERLLSERSGILNWALTGLARLRGRGFFVQPAAGREDAKMLELTGSSIKLFVEDCCELSADLNVEKKVLFGAWQGWAERNGVPVRGMTSAIFSQALGAAFPEIDVVGFRPGTADRARVYRGIAKRKPPLGAMATVQKLKMSVVPSPAAVPLRRRI